MNASLRLSLWSSLLLSGVALGAPVGGTGDVEQLRQAELRQSQIRAQTQAAAEGIQQVIADFEANGLGEGDDVKLLRALHAMLGGMTGEQMQHVISLLQQARAAP